MTWSEEKQRLTSSHEGSRDQVVYESMTTHDGNVILYCCHGSQMSSCCQNCATCLGRQKAEVATVTSQLQYSNHCHPARDEGVDRLARRRLLFASALCLVFMIGEIVGGLLANSLAIATDAAHLLTDFASFMISLMALWVGSRPATKRMSFGWYRAEVIGALTSVLLIWVVTGILVYMAVLRVVQGNYEIDAMIMLITASVGVLVNIIMGVSLKVGGVPHGHSHGGGSSHSHSDSKGGKNLNVRAAFIHVIGDFIQSVGVLIAAAIIYFKPHLVIVDPICTFLFSVLVLFTTFAIMKDTINVLMEGIPKSINFLEVQKTIAGLPGVVAAHNLRIWSLSMDKVALSAHIAVNEGEKPADILQLVSNELRSRYAIFELTLQVEEYKTEMDACNQCKDPKD